MLGFNAISETAISSLSESLAVVFSGTVTYTSITSDDFRIYAATEEYISRSTDTPAGQPFLGTLIRLPTFDRSIITGDGFSGLANQFGTAGLINVEHDYDGIPGNYAVDGREVVFKAGHAHDPYASFFEVARVIATSITVDAEAMRVNLQDKSFLLDVPAQPNVYQGIGDLEGGTELTGKRKPLALGRLKNITPVTLIPAELVLQVNDGAVSAISAVYDKGYPLTATSDYATPALLRAATITDGGYATCLAFGLLRPGSAYERITCDVNGDAAGGYVETTGTIIRRIVALTGCIDDPADVDTVSFAALEATQPAPIGYYLGADSTETVAQTFDKLMKGIGGFCGFTRLGILQAGVFTAPSGTPAAEYTDLDIVGEVSIERLPSGLDPPPLRQRIAYERNWTIIEDPFAGVVELDPTRASWLGTPYRVASTSEAQAAAIADDHLLAQNPDIVESYFALAIDAQAEAERRHTLANAGYQLYRVELKAAPFTLDLCQTARITLAALGFDAGKLGRIAAVSDIPDEQKIELRVFA